MPNRRESSWHLITGEYPPDQGGVADYTRVVATALAVAGVVVHVWAPGFAKGPTVEPGGIAVHRIVGHFGPIDLARLDRELNRFPGPRTILLQYSPTAFGWKAMNLPFAAWILSRRLRRGDDVRVMFHEVAFPWVRRPIRHNLLAAVNRVMAALLIRGCTRAYVSIPGWEPILRRVGPKTTPIVWTPIPSSVPDGALPEAVARRRAQLTGDRPATPLVGHFGTYGSLITQYLSPALDGLLQRRPDARVVLLGVGGDQWRGHWIGSRSDRADRVVATGPLPAAEVGETLRACDLMIQPYPDGVSSRRTTVMAALANGVPVVTTFGALSEPIWRQGAVVLAPVGDVRRLVESAVELLADRDRRMELGRAGQKLYEERFALRHTIAALLDQTGPTSAKVRSTVIGG